MESTYLSDGPGDDDWCVLGVGEDALGGVVEAEEGGTVDDDTLYRDAESTVKSTQTVSLVDLDQAVAQAGEFTLTSAFAYIGGQPIIKINFASFSLVTFLY